METKDVYKPVYDIHEYIEKRLKEATDEEIEHCFWLCYEDEGPIADALQNERSRRQEALGLIYYQRLWPRGEEA